VAEKVTGMKFCMSVGLLSGQVFSHFGGQRSRSPGTKNAQLVLPRSGGMTNSKSRRATAGECDISAAGEARHGIRNWGRRRRLRPCGGICVLQAC